MKLIVFILLISLSPLSQRGLFAQDNSKAEVRNVLGILFDGMREGDSSKVRSVFRPEARIYTSFLSQSGERVLKAGSLDDFLIAIGTAHEEIYDERLSNINIQIDGGIAQVWTDYNFYIGEKFSHCGVDAFQLVLEDSGKWRILHLMDTRRREGCNSNTN